MDEQTKLRLRELMFFVVPDPDEQITDEVLARSESINYEEGEQLKDEFRTLIESLDQFPDVREKVLAALDDMEASSQEAPCDDVEWMNCRDVQGRRVRRSLATVI